MNTYVINFCEGEVQSVSLDTQVWRDILSGAKSVQWANLFTNGILAATWIPGLLSVNDATTTNGLDPIQ